MIANQIDSLSVAGTWVSEGESGGDNLPGEPNTVIHVLPTGPLQEFRLAGNRPGVYLIRNLFDGKSYVGSASNLRTRLNRHRGVLRRGVHENGHLQAAWNLYGEECFEFVVVAYIESLESVERKVVEKKWIEDLKADVPAFGYNLDSDPFRSPGSVSQETRLKMSLSKKGRKQTAEHVLKSVLARRGVPQGPLTCEHREKLSVAHSKQRYIVTDPTGATFTITNLYRFCPLHGLTYECMLGIARGKQKMHRGWTCYYDNRSVVEEL